MKPPTANMIISNYGPSIPMTLNLMSIDNTITSHNSSENLMPILQLLDTILLELPLALSR
jgi:hypothetical protein